MSKCDGCNKWKSDLYYIECKCGNRAQLVDHKGGDIVVNLKEIKQNGVALDSPLLWALLPDWPNWIGQDESKEWFIMHFPLPKNIKKYSNYGYRLNLKINYTGDWKDSLTKRPEGKCLNQ